MINVEFFGKSAHASAAPWDGMKPVIIIITKGINALDAMCLAYQNISVLRQQMQTTNRVHGIIKKGGEAPNIIPDYTHAEYFTRYVQNTRYNTSAENRAELLKLIPRGF